MEAGWTGPHATPKFRTEGIMAYRTPLREFRFVQDELFDLPALLGLPAFKELESDLVAAVLDENARFVQSEIAPLNATGDTSPARWHDGAVETPPGFRQAFERYAQGGWQGLQHEAALD